MGYHRAGFTVVGVDIKPMPNYPFEFHQGDALEYLREHGHEFDAIHASPPCQAYSRSMRHLSHAKPMLIDACRDLLIASGRAWVIENVEGAPLATESDIFGSHGVLLCGSQFGLRVWRHRLFETSFPVSRPRPCNHSELPINPHRATSRARGDTEGAWVNECGLSWMTQREARQAIPPAYTEYLGKQLAAHLSRQMEPAA
jgi:DNA (cytosine-5)-methyltransferase 1